MTPAKRKKTARHHRQRVQTSRSTETSTVFLVAKVSGSVRCHSQMSQATQ